jgi:hypothetical protein
MYKMMLMLGQGPSAGRLILILQMFGETCKNYLDGSKP